MLKISSRIRADMFFADVQHVSSNPHVSPVFDILNMAIAFGMYNEVFQMVALGYYFSGQSW